MILAIVNLSHILVHHGWHKVEKILQMVIVSKLLTLFLVEPLALTWEYWSYRKLCTSLLPQYEVEHDGEFCVSESMSSLCSFLEMGGNSKTECNVTVHNGYLPRGDDLGKPEKMTLMEAVQRSLQLEGCVGFTHRGYLDDNVYEIFFKSKWHSPFVDHEQEWKSYQVQAKSGKLQSLDAFISLKPGVEVVVKGLAKDTAYNGKIGQCKEWRKKQGDWAVIFEGEKNVKYLKEEFLAVHVSKGLKEPLLMC
jgi:hypothetical protein